ncbi:alpha/beta hydrolase [Gellertiella hungarica]|uniref:Alpha-beta hydrolase superfamily lysophospholipase n=1 Tax=Gellertiella hungarica TaxID=1572859 RepID=A0A7W6J835_9HYPH|nr:alpha/beta fold hydrolase [Gellertiella hungarica]MBB4066538.1 alpha-beta hydrolase superfamily lysophospholipase [Gellertiella hungarica]
MKRDFGIPVTFGACAGFVHDGGGTTGILLLPAWGFEEFTIRRGWAGLAAMLADAGYCCLRFDWPGAGDSLGDAGSGVSLADWTAAVEAAADFLRSRHGVSRIVLAGHGVGALLAPHLAAGLKADAVVTMAPQGEGRAGLRELEAWSKLIASFLRLPPESSEDRIHVAGHAISKKLAEEIAALRIAATKQPALPVLAVLRAGTLGAVEWPKRLAEAGFSVTVADYAGYDGFLAHTMASVPPLADFAHVRDWLTASVPPGDRRQPAGQPTAIEPLHGPGFSETPQLFGEEGRLFGILCRPEGQPSRGVYVLVNSGDNYHVGWARMHVDFARQLAARGFSSFRIDTAGIGDSEATSGPLFYDPAQVRDVLTAVGHVAGMGLGPVLVSGRCSGGYASFQAAAGDPRIAGMVAVNPARLALAPGETFEQVMSGGTSSLADYRKRALSPRLLKDILTGRVPVASIAAKGARMVKTQLAVRFPALFGMVTGGNAVARTARAQADAIRTRGAAAYLVYADNDGGLDDLARLFGRREPGTHDHAIVRLVPDAEHNMTAPHARQAILSAMIDAAETVAARHSGAVPLDPAA